MRTLVFDGRTGAAGDMICAALIAAGADSDALAPVSDRLPIRYEIGETTKNGIRATTVDVLLDGDSGRDHAHTRHDHAHTHDHAHGDGHAGDAEDADDDEHAREHDRSHEHADAESGPTRDDSEHAHAEGAGVHRSY